MNRLKSYYLKITIVLTTFIVDIKVINLNFLDLFCRKMMEMTSEVWLHFSVQAKCSNCHVEILIQHGNFSLLLSHLRTMHNILFEAGVKKQHDVLKQVFEEERRLLHDEEEEKIEKEYVDDIDSYNVEDSKPIGIQILKLKEEADDCDSEEFKEDIYLWPVRGQDDSESNCNDMKQEINECSINENLLKEKIISKKKKKLKRNMWMI